MPYSREADMSVEQDSGAIWSVYFDPNHQDGFTIVTSAGAELLERGRPQLRDLIIKYRASELGKTALLGLDPSMRQELGSGREATVFSMGEQFAIREQVGMMNVHAAVGQLQRMDAISDIIDHGLPRWLKLPVHFAVHVDPEVQKTYTLMERINGGVTVEDVNKYPAIPQAKKLAVKDAFGNGNAIHDAKKAVPGLYSEAYEVLAVAISAADKEPTNYLTDWKERNVIVEPLTTPIARSKYRLSVIDQYTS